MPVDHDISNMTEPDLVRSFASYSRRDSGFVEPIVSLMRTAGGHIFYDQTDIAPGDKWNTVISNGLNKAQVLFVFWSKHASQSDYVRDEVETAINQKKTIVPVLLDDTELWDVIAEFQWVDFRGRISSFPFPNAAPKSLASRSFSWLILPVTSAILFGSALWIRNGESEVSNNYSFPIAAVMVVFIVALLGLIWKVVTFIISKGLRKFGTPVVPEPWFELAKELDLKARELAVP